ncbi:GGDEF domain-containing protein [Salinimonas sp. HHU 13199]|uniref:diguanylate cyclase n=1 Tax=Salinimonas profundi TaxID=2729140 RepID=A0ABR8LHQ6_9ALTE|nr:GGDEF domain-containing protein [Salinimonas profundi]MBD3584728.1 GGDEF domain-containing protein [Salinimonas profundi]
MLIRLPVLPLFRCIVLTLLLFVALPSQASDEENARFSGYSNLTHAVIYDWGMSQGLSNPQIEQALKTSDIENDSSPLGIVFRHIMALSHQGFDDAPANLPPLPSEPVTEAHWRYLKKLDPYRYAANRAYFIFLEAMIAYNGSTDRLTQSIPALQKLKSEMLEAGHKSAVATVSMWLANEFSENDPFSAKAEIEYALPHLVDFDRQRAMETQLDPDHAHTWLAQFYKEFNVQSRVVYHAQKDIEGARQRNALRADYFGDAILALNRMGRFDEAGALAEEATRIAQQSGDHVQKVIALAYRLSVYTHRQDNSERQKIVMLAREGAAVSAESLPPAWQMLPSLFHAIATAIEGSQQAFDDAVSAYQAVIDKQLDASYYPKTIELLNHYNLRRIYKLRGDNKNALRQFELYDQKMLAYNTESYSLNDKRRRDPLSEDIEFTHLRLAKAKEAEQALRLETERLRAIVAGLIASLLGVLTMWFWQRQRRSARLADTDSLTGALTRRALYSALSKPVNDNITSCMVLIDLDYFKQVNDHYGHVVGDEVLTITSNIIQSRIRKSDKLCRYGGEEFLLYLHDIDKTQAIKLVDDIRETLNDCCTWTTTDARFSVSFSAGITEVINCKDIDAIVATCDTQLYNAKAAGRACTRAIVFG